MSILESVDITPKEIKQAFRFPVQYVNRPHLNFRGFAGTIASGNIQVGDQITVLPSHKTTRIASIIEPSVEKDSTIQSAFATMAVTFTTEDEIDISRGDLLVKTDEQAPALTDSIQATLVWMHESPAQLGKEYVIKHTTHKVKGHIESIEHIIDVNTFEKKAGETLQLNDIALCNLTLNRAIPVDSYEVNKITGSFIVIDRYTHATVAAGMIAQANQPNQSGAVPTQREYSEFERDLNALVLKHFPEWEAKSIDKLLGG